jgi:hypothetical protein
MGAQYIFCEVVTCRCSEYHCSVVPILYKPRCQRAYVAVDVCKFLTRWLYNGELLASTTSDVVRAPVYM